MKAISITQPWASLMAIGAKHYETRGSGFGRQHIGLLAIAASKGCPRDCKDLILAPPFSTMLKRAGYQTPRPILEECGHVLAIVEVVGYCDAEDVSPSAAHPRCYSWGDSADPAEHEAEFGDYSDGRTIILTRNPRRLVRPVPVERLEGGIVKPGGALGIYELSPACEAAARSVVVK